MVQLPLFTVRFKGHPGKVGMNKFGLIYADAFVKCCSFGVFCFQVRCQATAAGSLQVEILDETLGPWTIVKKSPVSDLAPEARVLERMNV